MPKNNGYRFGSFFKFISAIFVPIVKPYRHGPQTIENAKGRKNKFKTEGLVVGCIESPSLGWVHSFKIFLLPQVQSHEQVRVTARAREPVAVGKSGRRAAIIHVPVGLGGPVHVGVLVVRLRYMLELKIGDDILA